MFIGWSVVASLGCGDAFETADTGGGGSGAFQGEGGSASDPIGCADGKRELFNDEVASPTVAGCSGAFDVPGVTTLASMAPSCGREAGDDGNNRDGVGCSVADLCAVGWHVCERSAEVSACSIDTAGPAFFVTRVSTTDGSLMCTQGGSDNLVGCGIDVGQPPDPADSCGALNTVLIFSKCDSELPAWWCGASTDVEAEVVTKSGRDEGGALCCRDA